MKEVYPELISRIGSLVDEWRSRNEQQICKLLHIGINIGHHGGFEDNRYKNERNKTNVNNDGKKEGEIYTQLVYKLDHYC